MEAPPLSLPTWEPYQHLIKNNSTKQNPRYKYTSGYKRLYLYPGEWAHRFLLCTPSQLRIIELNMIVRNL